MSQKYDRFVVALKRLCREHGVELCDGEGALEVWDLAPGQDPVDETAVVDRTAGAKK